LNNHIGASFGVRRGVESECSDSLTQHSLSEPALWHEGLTNSLRCERHANPTDMKYTFDHELAAEGRVQLKRKKTPRDFREERHEDATSDADWDETSRSRYLAANNRNFGTKLAFVLDFVPQS
jgi:hypothetical protein